MQIDQVIKPAPVDGANTKTAPFAAVDGSQSTRPGRVNTRGLVGLPVILLTTGDRQGEIRQVIIDYKLGRLRGFILEQGGTLLSHGETLVLPEAGIHSIGIDAVTISSLDLLVVGKDAAKDLEAQAGESAMGKSVITRGGNAVGSVADVLIDRESHLVLALEVTGSLWQNLTRGVLEVNAANVISVGKDVVVIRDLSA